MDRSEKLNYIIIVSCGYSRALCTNEMFELLFIQFSLQQLYRISSTLNCKRQQQQCISFHRAPLLIFITFREFVVQFQLVILERMPYIPLNKLLFVSVANYLHSFSHRCLVWLCVFCILAKCYLNGIALCRCALLTTDDLMTQLIFATGRCSLVSAIWNLYQIE